MKLCRSKRECSLSHHLSHQGFVLNRGSFQQSMKKAPSRPPNLNDLPQDGSEAMGQGICFLLKQRVTSLGTLEPHLHLCLRPAIHALSVPAPNRIHQRKALHARRKDIDSISSTRHAGGWS
jgi:hypothetical protein